MMSQQQTKAKYLTIAGKTLQVAGYILHEDPGHAWLEVDRKTLSSLGIAYNITKGSYQKKDKAYLEEDCDLTVFCLAMKATVPGWELRGTYATQYYDTMWPGQDGFGRYATFEA